MEYIFLHLRLGHKCQLLPLEFRIFLIQIQDFYFKHYSSAQGKIKVVPVR
jgi:hypothetical protein